jgi:hypothetical protein
MTVFSRSVAVVSARLRLEGMGPTSEILDAATGVLARPMEEEETVCPAEEP